MSYLSNSADNCLATVVPHSVKQRYPCRRYLLIRNQHEKMETKTVYRDLKTCIVRIQLEPSRGKLLTNKHATKSKGKLFADILVIYNHVNRGTGATKLYARIVFN